MDFYTNDVYNGKITELRDYAYLCSHAFGAMYDERDNMNKERPKLYKVEDYYYEEVSRTELELFHIRLCAATEKNYQEYIKSKKKRGKRKLNVKKSSRNVIAQC